MGPVATGSVPDHSRGPGTKRERIMAESEPRSRCRRPPRPPPHRPTAPRRAPVTSEAAPDEPRTERADVAGAHRIVVKIGSSSLTSASGRLDPARPAALVEVLAGLHRRGKSVVLVSSGAVAAGLAPLGLTTRPTELSEQQ